MLNPLSRLKILKFSAAWCGPCKQMREQRTLEKITEYFGVPFEEIDIAKDVRQRDKFQVQSVPTIIIMRDDIPVKRLSSYCTFDTISKELLLLVE